MMDVEARVGKLKNKGDGEEESRCGAGHEPVRAGRERGRGRGGGRGGDTSFQVELTLKKKIESQEGFCVRLEGRMEQADLQSRKEKD